MEEAVAKRVEGGEEATTIPMEEDDQRTMGEAVADSLGEEAEDDLLMEGVFIVLKREVGDLMMLIDTRRRTRNGDQNENPFLTDLKRIILNVLSTEARLPRLLPNTMARIETKTPDMQIFCSQNRNRKDLQNTTDRI